MVMLIAVVGLVISVANSSCLLYWEYRRHLAEQKAEEYFEKPEKQIEEAQKQLRDAMRKLNR